MDQFAPASVRSGRVSCPDEVTGDDMVSAMNQAGVDGALLVSVSSYGSDPSYIVDVRQTYPSRFAMILPSNPHQSDVTESIAEWSKVEGAVGIRLVLIGDLSLAVGDLAPAVAAAGHYDLPLCLLCSGRLDLVGDLAARYPDTRTIVDHLGLLQRALPPPPDNPFEDLENLLALPRYPNLAVKMTGAATLSHQPFPFDDMWLPLERVFDSFGLDRCMWGTDWTRTTEFVSHSDAIATFRDTSRLSEPDREALMGETLSQIFGGSPTPL